MDRKTFINIIFEDFIENVLREIGLFMLMKTMQEQKELDIREFTNRWTRRHHPIFSANGSDYAFAVSDIIERVGFERPAQE